jgi:hypothetical protein
MGRIDRGATEETYRRKHGADRQRSDGRDGQEKTWGG